MNNKLKCHVFICTNCSYDQGDVTIEPSNELRDTTKELASKLWDKGQVRINKSGCLGKCSEGISCVIYPQQEWLTKLKQEDSQKIINAIDKLIK
ncbi:ferredoxin [Halobacteriovorax sp. HLS]|uniref:(2Fe-2S) ferredoxin domain-containing protein n=1 Tax=Halobacteriovorax sp. HLS TaxID=2234000 RepID=UPI000FD84D44|nr:(2Fe-2S) ferredoxin domain-containing protein [Halobacteriovorax sp. HLS]